MNVESAFEAPIFSYYSFDGILNESGVTNLSNVFSNENIYINGMANCFLVSTNVESNNSVIITDQPVTFNNMFNRYNKTASNSDRYVFCGYNLIGSDPDKNQRFTNKTLRTDANRHNYDARIV